MHIKLPFFPFLQKKSYIGQNSIILSMYFFIPLHHWINDSYRLNKFVSVHTSFFMIDFIR